MFQKFLFNLSNLLGKIYGKFNVAYNETYSDKKLGKSANSEIEKRKDENKENFIEQLAFITIVNAWEKDRFYIPLDIARSYAEYVFDKQKEYGNIDNLNNLKGNNNE